MAQAVTLRGNVKNRNFDVPATIRMYSEQDLIRFVDARNLEARTSRAWENMRNQYTFWRNAYNGQYLNVAGVPRWRTRLYVRLAFKIVETLRAFADDAIFGTNPFIKLDPTSVLWKKNAQNMEVIMQHEAEQTRKRKKYQHVINGALKYGIGISQNFWNFQRSFRPVRMFERTQQGFLTETGQQEQSYVKIDSPDFEWVDPIEVAFDPFGTDIHNMRYASREKEVEFDQLVQMQRFANLFNLDKVKDDFRGASIGRNLGFGRDPFLDPNYDGVLGEEERNAAFDESRRRVHIRMYEGRLDMPGNHNDPRIYYVWIANDRHIIRLQRSPYSFDQLSYNLHYIIPQDDRYNGIGAIEPILTDQRIMNVLVNTRLDSLHLLISPRFLAHKNSLEPGMTGIDSIPPGGFANVKALGDISKTVQQINIQDNGFSSWSQWFQFQNRNAEDTMAANPNVIGQLSAQKRSATEVQRAVEGSQARFIHMINNFIESGYYDHTRKEMMMIQQFMTKSKRVKITADPNSGDFDRNIMPWDIQGDFQFLRTDPTKGSKDVESQLFINLLQAFAPFFQLTGLDPKPFMRGVLEASPMAKKLKVDQLFPPEEVSPGQAEILNNENQRLEKALEGGGTQPGGGIAPGAAPITIPQGEQTALGIAQAGL